MKYKYLGNDRLSLKPLIEGTIKYATLKDLNDPYEATSALRHDEGNINQFIKRELFPKQLKTLFGDTANEPLFETLKQTCPDLEFFKHTMENTLQEFLSEDQQQEFIDNLSQKRHQTYHLANEQRHQTMIDDQFGILCLSNTCESYLMWSHYSNKHLGYCIGFDESDSWFDPLSLVHERPATCAKIGTLVEVNYSTERIEQPKSKADLNSSNFLDPYFHKATDWIYEEEYRILHPLNCSEPSNATTIASQKYPNLKLVYNKKNRLYTRKLPKNLIKEIIFGVRCSIQTQEEIRNQLADVDVNYFFAIPSSSDYSINKEPVIFDYPYDPMDIDLIKQGIINNSLHEIADNIPKDIS